MNRQELLTKAETRISELLSIFREKNDEYAKEDALHNFKKVARSRAISPEEVLMGFVSKHWAALDDFVVDIASGKVRPRAMWKEKTGDIILYMLLLDSMVDDRLDCNPCACKCPDKLEPKPNRIVWTDLDSVMKAADNGNTPELGEK